MKTLFAHCLIVSIFLSSAQIFHPVRWSFKMTKISGNTYTFCAKATMEDQWHIYSHIQPGNAISTPTTIVFDKKLGIQTIGKLREIGKLEKYLDKKNNIGANEYAGEVEFTQLIVVKNTSQRKLWGIVTYQACTNKQCLQPDNADFSLDIY